MTVNSAILHAPDEATAIEQLHELGCTDGLPIIVPTPERVERMVLAGGVDGDLTLGNVAPLGRRATVEAVAANAVMAGCLPDYFPIVLAAVRAALDPMFDLHELQATTHSLAPLVIVNGPARISCGPVASGFGALGGAGHRANATIGRALRLVMIGLGGGTPGVGDMALFGQPGKLSFCTAENEEASPFEPLHVARGFTSDVSLVTLVGVESPHSVLCVTDDDVAGSAERLLACLAAGVACTTGNNAYLGTGAIAVLLNPDHASRLDRAGYDRAAVQAGIAERAYNRRGHLRSLNPFAVAVADGPDDELVYACDADDLVLIVAGGPGMYSAVMPSWGTGPHKNRTVSAEIEIDPACSLK